MEAHLLRAVTLALQQATELTLARAIIFFDGVNPARLPGPFLIQPIRDRLLAFLVGPVVPEKDDVAELGMPEAARRVFEDLLEDTLPAR